MNNNQTCAAREPVSAEVTSLAERLANRAEQLADRVNGKLTPVMNREHPPVCGDIKNNVEQVQHPPLFAILFSNFNVISRALDSIEDSISRTEL